MQKSNLLKLFVFWLGSTTFSTFGMFFGNSMPEFMKHYQEFLELQKTQDLNNPEKTKEVIEKVKTIIENFLEDIIKEINGNS